MKILDKVIIAITTLFGIGFIPLGGGTVASIFAILIFFIIKNKLYFFIFTGGSIILAFLFSGKAEKIFCEKDCKKIVIDDFVGMLISLLIMQEDFIFILCTFLLFRMFDALKVPPIDSVEKLPSSLGIVLDDILAGIYTFIVMIAVKFLTISF